MWVRNKYRERAEVTKRLFIKLPVKGKGDIVKYMIRHDF